MNRFLSLHSGVLHELIRPHLANEPGPLEAQFKGYVQSVHGYADGHSFTLEMLTNPYEISIFKWLTYIEVDEYYGSMRSPNTTLEFSTRDPGRHSALCHITHALPINSNTYTSHTLSTQTILILMLNLLLFVMYVCVCLSRGYDSSCNM